ncbi:MAG: T9SS type A sorting domain-containing protein [Paludibacteraceae bacterium]|nr:T9SS type A sorting domain-containing protein [Paludibacteraceae bacterium]MBP3575186.1 T9SS type A sorting domain-containing protein [Paludibacteraceae bacterium]
MKQFLRYILTLVAFFVATTPAWAATATLGAKKQNVTADGITFSLGGSYTINNFLVDYSYTGSGKEATLSWTVPTGYTISVSQITIDAYSENSWWTQGKGQYKTSKNGSYSQFCNSNSFVTYTLNSSSYFPLGNDGSITMKAIDRELRWRDIVFTYTKTAHKYNIAFNANGGTGTTQGISNVSYDTNVNLTPNGFTRNKFIVTYDANGGTCATAQEIRNYTFAGWAETSTGNVKYSDQQVVRNLSATNGATVTLYAKWNEPDNATLTLPTATKTGAVLEGWYLGDTKIGEAGDTYTPTSSVTLTAKWIEKYTPEITGSDATILVGEEIPNAFTFKNTSNPTAIITKKSISDIRNGEDVITYDATENKIIAHNAGIAEIYFVQDPTSTIEGGTSATYTITVNKRPTSFSLINLTECYTGDYCAFDALFATATNNTEVPFTCTTTPNDNSIIKYENGILSAVCAGTGTFKIEQQENYKWLAHSQTLTINVKKYDTQFSWLLSDTYYVDDVITSIFSKSNNGLPSTITSSDPNIVKVDGNQLVAMNAGTATITVSQAVDCKWTEFTKTQTITVKKHDIVAHINPSTALWNELVANPFSATSTHPITGQVTAISNFTVTQQGNEHIALMDANTRNIQTYYTNGTVEFLITRLEDRKYNALSQTLTLTVNASTENCDIFTDPTERNFSTGITDFSGKAGYAYEIPEDVRAYADSVYITAKRTGENYFYLQYSTNGGAQWTDFPEGLLDLSTSSYKTFGLKIPEGKIVTHIRPFAKTGATLRKDYKDFRVTRAKELTPSDSPVILPVTSIGTPETKTFTLKWSTCADEILLTNSNPHFTINTHNISSTAGQGSTAITVTCDASVVDTLRDTIVIYDQTQRIFVPVECIVNDKFIANIKGTTAYSKKVDDTWVADFKFDTCQTTLPSDDINAPFYYTIKHDLTGNNVLKTGYEDLVITYVPTYNPDTKEVVNTITAHNAGTAVITFIQRPTESHYTDTLRCVITVSKHDVELQWKDPVYFNDTVYNYFTTSNTTSPIVIESQTDTDVAKLTNEFNPTSNNSLDLITFYKEASTTVTVSQVETYYWNGYSIPHTITPIDQNNHVTFTLTQENYIPAFKHSFVDPAANDQSKGPDWQSGGIYFGGEGAFEGDEGWNWNEKYYIIQFTGIPDSIYFDASRAGAATGTIKLSVSEGKTPDNLTEVWSNSNNSENNKIIRKLNPDSRYLKFSYTGNLWGLFKNITVTELNEFRAVDSQDKTLDKDTLDFGANQVYRNKTRTFELRYANPGYKITVESTNPKFTVTPDFIGDIGGEYHGTRTITVSYTSTVPDTISGEDMIIINDEIGHTDTIRLYASSYKAEQVLHWRADFETIPTPIIRTKNGDITDAAWATSQLPVTYTSSNENVIKISDDGTTLIPVAEGEVEITAYQLGNEMWLPADPITKTFIVTDKLLQYIVWDDDLTNIIKDDTNPQTLTLTAQVYLQLEDNSVVFSQEQTNNLKYQSGNDNIVSAVGSTLTIHNVGRTTLTATVEGNNDYATASMTKTVIVRSATPGCDDNLLYHHEGDPIQFFQYNLDEIIKEPIALDRNQGIPGYVIVAHYGQSWNLGIQYYSANIRVEQSLDNGSTWNTIETIQPVKNQENIDSIPLSRQATHIRFVRNANGQGYQFLYNIDVHPAQYIEAQDVVDFGEIHVGSRETRTFPLHYSNIKHSLSPVPSTSEVTATPNTFGECSGFGTQDISVTWLPTQVSDNATATITFTDPNSGMEKVVTLVAKVFKGTQNIIWDNIPTIIEDCGDIQFPEKTTANLPITWTVIDGKEFADFNEQGMLELYKNGTITVQATQEGTSNYKPLDPISYTFDIQLNIAFVGTEDSDWHNPNNWAMCRLPYPTEVVTMEHPATLSAHATVAGVIFSTNGSIHITPTGGLSVGARGIQGAATDGSSIIIDNLKTGIGFLRISPEYQGAMPRATVNYQTRSTLDTGANRDATWQYFGAPGNDVQFTVDYITWLYQWSEPQNWINKTGTLTLEPFAGYAITQYGKPTYALSAEAITSDQTITLTKTESGMNGNNLFANSYMAPIDAKNFTPEDFSDYNTDREDIVKTFYIFNSGSWNDWNKYNTEQSKGSNGNDVPGQYCAVPAFSSKYMDSAEITTLPPMQGIYVIANTNGAHIHLNYEKHVWNAGTNPKVSTDMHEPMRTPQRLQAEEQMQQDNFRRIRIQLNSANSGADRLYIIQTDETTPLYDNGYDAPNQTVSGLTNIYTTESFGKMEVSCSNRIDSMYIGFQAGSDTQYTLSFSSLIGDMLYLEDLEQDTIVAMQSDEPYTFQATPQSVNDYRFRLLIHPKGNSDSPNTPTDTEQADNIRVWINNDMLHIIGATANTNIHIYNISGTYILSDIVSDSPYTCNVAHLQSGVYLIRLNEQIYKVIKK